MKLTLILMMIFVSSTLYAQLPEEIQWKHLVKTYAPDSSEMVLSLNGKPLDGKYRIPLDENSFALYTIKDGMINGQAFWYSNGGHLECKLFYKKGVRDGIKENYDSENKVWLRQEYKAGKQHGINEMYSNGKLVHKTEYKDGKKHGWHYAYTDNRVTTESYYEDGMQNGAYRSYMRDGKLIIEANYKDDQRHGLTTMFTNGIKNMDFNYENGQKNGLSHMYKPDGSVIFENYFLLDKKVGKADFDKYQEDLKMKKAGKKLKE